MDKTDTFKRWREYFNELLNAGERNDDELPTFYDVEQELDPPSREEVRKCIQYLKNNKAPGIDCITAELIKKGGSALENSMYQLIKRVWEEEQIPEQWNLGVIIPILKKGDKSICSNYRGITLLCTAYKIFTGVIYLRLKSYSEEITGDYQCGFRPNRSTSDQIHLMRQTLEKAYEYDINLHHIFVDFQRAFDSVDRCKIPYIMRLLGIPSKLARLIEITLKNTKAVVSVQNDQSEPFKVQTGVRQGDALSAVVFNLVIEAAMRKMTIGGLIDFNTSQIAAYADDIVITSRSKNSVIKLYKELASETQKFGLQVNVPKTKYLVSSRTQDPVAPLKIDECELEQVNSFRYLGSILNAQNSIEEEIKARLLAGNKCFYACSKLLGSKVLSHRTKIILYKALVRPIVTYACETWSLTVKDENKLAIFERKVLRKIFGAVREDNGSYRYRMNFELENLIRGETITRHYKSQRLRWLGHLERMSTARGVRTITKWTPQQKRQKGRPKKRWMDCIEDDLRKMGNTSWRNNVTTREEWRKIVKEAKTHKGL